MLSTTVSSLSSALVALCVWLIYLNSKRRGKLPPGPKGYPLVGNIFELDLKRPWHTFVEWKKTYGDIVHFRLFNQDVILLNSAKVAGDLLDRRAANYSQRYRMTVTEYLTGGLDIVFMNPGLTWRSMRRAAHEALNVRASMSYYPIQMHEGIRLAMNMLDSPEKYQDHTSKFASQGVAYVVYNDPSCGNTIEFVMEYIDIILNSSLPGNYLANLIPSLRHAPDFLAKWKREAKERHRVTSEKFLSYFLPIKEAVLRGQETGTSFCSMLVESHERHGLNDLESAWLAAMVLLAGIETTMTTLGWMILAMITFPEVQRKAQEELDRVVGRTRIPTLNDMENLPYMRALVKEALRWRPAPPMGVFHMSLEDDIYEGYHISKGSLVIPNILAMNHDMMTYGPNPDEFRPERFLNDDGTHKESPPDTKDEGHYTFGFGHRICPGRHLATNALFTFAIVLWAMHLEPGKDAQGNETVLSTDDETSGIISRAPSYSISSKPRFPGALEILRSAKEDWP
ncbi:cytochrome p450 [Moniliophthora roreri MCA 2997]|uniref:Cytochrome p450 n=1 Tax=Moniliophthora roreri (strain MCA 2997) TaxID=1381753 RepID=V2WRI5_MONRO|nr:cytochrome p450 [Moniliophthora roreri MCA 2997]